MGKLVRIKICMYNPFLLQIDVLSKHQHGIDEHTRFFSLKVLIVKVYNSFNRNNGSGKLDRSAADGWGS